ncbi:MAG: RNA polymerase sigma factor [Alphaproteobacteria bacterium]|nr:RNA polymerase sigma factor [Alphaproteobacteria bacterium]
MERPLLALRLHTNDPDETILMARALDGDPSAREWLVQRWTPPVYRFCRRMLKNDEDARDAAQDTLVKVLKSLDRYDPTRAFSTWVFGIARNTCIDEHRRRRKRAWDEPPDVPADDPTPLQVTSEGERARQLSDALELLPPLYREVLVLYHFEHMKYCEIAETLDLPMGTVMNRIFRARRKLRDLYTDAGGEQ